MRPAVPNWVLAGKKGRRGVGERDAGRLQQRACLIDLETEIRCAQFGELSFQAQTV